MKIVGYTTYGKFLDLNIQGVNKCLSLITKHYQEKKTDEKKSEIANNVRNVNIIA